MTEADLTAIVDFARSRGAVARRLNPLVLIVTTPEYADSNPALSGQSASAQDLPLAQPAAPEAG